MRISTPKVKIPMFNTVMGKDGLRMIEKLVDTKTADLVPIVKALENYFIVSTNPLYERFQFNKVVQNKNEPIKDLIERLKEEVKSREIDTIAHLSRMS